MQIDTVILNLRTIIGRIQTMPKKVQKSITTNMVTKFRKMIGRIIFTRRKNNDF